MNAKEVIKQGLIDTGLVKQGSDWNQVFDGEIGYATEMYRDMYRRYKDLHVPVW